MNLLSISAFQLNEIKVFNQLIVLFSMCVLFTVVFTSQELNIFRFFSSFHNWLGKVRLCYCLTPYQQLWLYNGAPLVAFYDTLGIRRTFSQLKPPASSLGFHNWNALLKSNLSMSDPSSEILMRSLIEPLLSMVLSLDFILFCVENPLSHVTMPTGSTPQQFSSLARLGIMSLYFDIM